MFAKQFYTVFLILEEDLFTKGDKFESIKIKIDGNENIICMTNAIKEIKKNIDENKLRYCLLGKVYSKTMKDKMYSCMNCVTSVNLVLEAGGIIVPNGDQQTPSRMLNELKQEMYDQNDIIRSRYVNSFS